MRVLLDTHVFLWWISDDPRLSVQARAVIADGSNRLFFSVASAWEIAIKAQLGKLTLPESPEQFLVDQLLKNSIASLPVQMHHALQVYHLPRLHRDPFDRMLVAQSQLEDLPILTADSAFVQYDVTVIW